MNNSTNNPRKLAVQSLVKTSSGTYSNLQIDAAIKNSNMSVNDANLYTNIVYGVIQHRLTLEYQLKPFIKNPEKIDSWVTELLYTAIYQLEYLDRIPKHAVFDESIKIAKNMGHDGIRRFVTGVLHQIDRQGLPQVANIKNKIKRLSIEYSVPVWIIEQLHKQVGENKTITILKSLNEAPSHSVRYNSRKIDKDILKDDLFREDYEVTDSKVSLSGLLLDNHSVVNSSFFKDGYLTIQDESAMLPVESMNIKPDELILDACAAPGGKTTQIAEKLDKNAGGKVVALDIHENKLKQINYNTHRLGVDDVVELLALDARKVSTKFEDETFDQILVDAPCSGLGLLRRKPEIRYEKSINDVKKLQSVQLEILNAVAKKVKINGMITYSTCTIVNQENQDVIDKFIQENPGFEVKFTETKMNLKANRENLFLNIYPDDYFSDGFFVCNLIRKN